MNLRDLKYLIALADHMHFGKAADACCISQPTLSMQIKKLEEFLGVQLIERTYKKFIFTPHGIEITAKARKIIHEANQIITYAQTAHDPFKGTINLGVIPTVAPYFLPKILPKLQKKYPLLQINIFEGQTQNITKQLERGILDLLLLALPIESDNFDFKIFCHEVFFLAVNTYHPFAKKSSITPNDLKKENVLLLTDGHCLRDQALDICHKVGAKENTNFQASSIETIRQMVIAGFGVTLMPQYACQNKNDIKYIPFKDPQPYRKVGLAWRQSSVKMPVIEDFKKTVTQEVTWNN